MHKNKTKADHTHDKPLMETMYFICNDPRGLVLFFTSLGDMKFHKLDLFAAGEINVFNFGFEWPPVARVHAIVIEHIGQVQNKYCP